ncbi:uncharacterized protein Z518_04468 [Rhinocladiella mackenziei CBS 650.93]|uniref:Amino acid permease/ SLC12A domain-containing protein n=1 Tax=Rhinocladiella mackenziei CBS 650.93 TaxID=1442369 RepID=A0A0D2FWE3_9EURO|nr:uncharacterized protein Z518_04468 [Rhinocladiella mackenziei CBS 650.93]KIX06492.1 hypothetical protein Z518_04468 [Rhinocladiella mackenziei CBS 650.93]
MAAEAMNSSSSDMSAGIEEKKTPSGAVESAIGPDEGALQEVSGSGDFHRSFSARQVHIISLGSNIGSGLFIGTGKALANGGPGNMILAYLIVGTGVWANLQTLTEMTIAFPTSGNYIDYAGRWVDPALAFGAGFAEWLGWTAVFAAEAMFFIVLVNLWAEGSVPEGALLTVFLVPCLLLFLLPNKWFAWVEYFGSLVKIFLFVLIVVLSFALIGGAGPDGYVHHGEFWTELPAFKNGFSGFANAGLLAIWAVGDQVFIGVMGGEAQFPRMSMAHAANLVPFRTNFIYMLLIVFITILVPSDDDRLLSGSGVAASPFVIAVKDAGIKGIPDLLNACMIIGIVAIAVESIYLPSRILREMALQKLVPAFIASVDARGRPRWALLITSAIATTLTYMSLSTDGTTVLNWLISITSASFFLNWMIIAFTSLRFHAAIRAQNDPIFSETYSWRSKFWPLAPIWVLLVSTVLLACCLAAGIDPLGDAGFTANNFFLYIIGILIIVVFTLAYKIIYRTTWQDPATADLVTGRRTISAEEIALLDAYFSMPLWRRIGTYVKLW